jgi:hypothetical protein
MLFWAIKKRPTSPYLVIYIFPTFVANPNVVYFPHSLWALQMASMGHLHLRSIEGSALATQWLERIRRCKHGTSHIVVGERLVLLKQVLCCFSIQPLSLLLANS